MALGTLREGDDPFAAEEIYQVNESARRMVRHAIMSQIVLALKLESLLELSWEEENDPPPIPVRDLPTCADLPADYCPAAKTPSPELFQRPQELQSSSPKTSSKPEAEPELFTMPAQPQAQKIETAPPPIAEPATRTEKRKPASGCRAY